MGLLGRENIELDFRGGDGGTVIRIRRVVLGVFRRTVAQIAMHPGIDGAPVRIKAVSLRHARDIALLESLLDKCMDLVAALEPKRNG
ncbi:hypothetical protein ZD22_001850 [Salmonella enterica subsp. enterica]|uniref:Uncharacterized protein n=1 Tax=Salmonella enterica TaxID=28901 RepID=A0A3R0QMJ0_SALER|nr:hypothetical protein [Salmonella enterica]EBH8100520.1 hypothetical protein [Salmonella enterica subsp. houtenae serovar O:11:g,z25:-]EBS1320333.1 hypothetical protein [Salmonella enterica subsp. enterica serovar Pomona]EDI3120908.1 hypothetical protein [Salmonella enterica subsp. enterica serovar Newport]EDV4373097.1 hypothetical protein [Salmonella enterica subsp. enterica]ELF1494031.1 hypothetical protein [Salmonella enterica subsp. enterica serovar Infantis]